MSRAHHFVTTRSGIVIGRCHIPRPPRELGSDAEHIQTALLHRTPPLFDRVMNALDAAPMPIFVAIVIAGGTYGLIKWIFN